MAIARFPGKSVDTNWSSPKLERLVCVNGTPWILYLLEECADNAWQYSSVVFGLVSMLCILLSTFPQVHESYQNGKADEAMSFGFLLFLFSGDIANLVGCYLTRQLPIQVVTVIFYIFTDLILISQFIYYKIKNNSNRENPVLKWLCCLWCGAGILLLLFLPKLIIDDIKTSKSLSPTLSKSLEVSGFVCGYLSTVFYISSRFPQLYKNFQRQSTEGTSYLLFALVMIGNLSYCLSIIMALPATKESKQNLIIKHLAWLIGSLGVLILDVFVTIQFVLYRKNKSARRHAAVAGLEVQPLMCGEVELSVLD
ncbi:lysosomal amino acid transporter 1 homolog [Syngnathoides biaculeatus]|uniref:lysosomal amino acid transporter 1 homolog n=1 Tax=Syngnathoides biaculeatus TaxID=300417 RepID=UPI002ADE8657|nr:lysosomal amino acid transporter 1 homolog [Syngnathoides biaculeatus]XP_061683299.1 lysosomal amino acid transporter 1 homolog [Syngnathoides biaculeatus]XP_061683300.1 lysosomal amino acid transporter 1 homolog [Syngnathoides biaculeatus]XP_061683301.1 lysosomal amino acid transporter 1 homolog [Syngnathoides biaculeatus]XP_061683302.1 lysosomal amino acid transporter 1 homolog [Syngnathoides biaculeatus]